MNIQTIVFELIDSGLIVLFCIYLWKITGKDKK